MGHHFCEQERFVQSEVSRRSILKGMLAGAAAGVPVAAEATSLSDEEQLEACIEQMRTILTRMHPKAAIQHPHYLRSGQDGSWRFSMQGDVVYGEYVGEGLYEIAMDGYLMTFWLEEDCYRNVKTGLPIPGMSYYRGTQWYDGEFLDDVRKFGKPNIVRKIEGVTR